MIEHNILLIKELRLDDVTDNPIDLVTAISKETFYRYEGRSVRESFFRFKPHMRK